MILSRDEFKIRLQERFGESESEDDIRLLEDLTDTFESYDTREAENQLAELQAKYADLQARYRARFFETGSEEPEDLAEPEPEPEAKAYRFDELFEKGV